MSKIQKVLKVMISQKPKPVRKNPEISKNSSKNKVVDTSCAQLSGYKNENSSLQLSGFESKPLYLKRLYDRTLNCADLVFQ